MAIGQLTSDRRRWPCQMGLRASFAGSAAPSPSMAWSLAPLRFLPAAFARRTGAFFLLRLAMESHFQYRMLQRPGLMIRSPVGRGAGAIYRALGSRYIQGSFRPIGTIQRV